MVREGRVSQGKKRKGMVSYISTFSFIWLRE
jgi:hypothetical protein